jgi:hypothetical protein
MAKSIGGRFVFMRRAAVRHGFGTVGHKFLDLYHLAENVCRNMLTFLFNRKGSLLGRSLVRGGLGGALAALAFYTTSSAAVILTIDITDPSSVRISGTGAFAENDDLDSTTMLEGFLLINFFDSDPGWDVPDYLEESELYSPGGTFEYTDLYYDGRDLNIVGGNFSSQDFSTTEAAFEGYAIADFSDVAHLLTAGRTGNIYAGDMWNSTVIIGQYEIIPEPSVSLLALGSVAVMLGRRRRY